MTRDLIYAWFSGLQSKMHGNRSAAKTCAKNLHVTVDPAGGPQPPSIAPIGVWLAALWAAGWAIEGAHHAETKGEKIMFLDFYTFGQFQFRQFQRFEDVASRPARRQVTCNYSVDCSERKGLQMQSRRRQRQEPPGRTPERQLLPAPHRQLCLHYFTSPDLD